MKISRIIIFASVLVLTCCSQYPIYRYNVSSLDNQKWFYKGREIISSEINDILAVISYEDQVRDNLVFNLSIINKSDGKIEIDPSKIFLEIQKTYPEDFYGNKKIIYNSIDPESRINLLNKSITSLNASQQTTDVVYTFVCLADLVKDFSELNKEKSTDELYAESLVRQERTQAKVSQDINYQNNLSFYMDSKYYWENLVLRKTTLYPDEEISGYVHLPLDENAREILICVPINNIEFSFKYSSRPLINRF